jgi:hypothetical protein
MECPICSVSVDLHRPGPCLDAWLAGKILGQTVTWVEDSTGSKRPDVPSFSTDIASAWIIVRKFQATSADLRFREGQFGVRFGGNREFTWSDQEPLAICRAAIRARS